MTAPSRIPAFTALIVALVAACGVGDAAKSDARGAEAHIDAAPDAAPGTPDAATCQPVTTDPAFVRAAGNPELRGGFTASDQMIDSAISDPDVPWDDAASRWQVYFATKHAGVCTPLGTAGVQQILHASSPWTPDAQNPVATLLRTPGTPTSGGGQPSVVYDTAHCGWEMWLRSDLLGETSGQQVAFNTMAGVWHATSPDSVTWSIDYAGTRDLSWSPTASGEDLGLLTGADVGARGDERLMVYVGFHDAAAGCELPPASGNAPLAGVYALDEAVRGAP